MSDGSSHVQRFTVDQGETFGPFDVPDAKQIHYTEVDFTARTLRFDAVATIGGNTGVVAIETYGKPR